MLSGMRVASFTHWLQGPATTQYLADMGADVIRVEAPGGSYERKWHATGRSVAGVGTLVLAAGRNARAVVIDLKTAEGKEVALRLIDSSDVVVENYRPGVMERLGLGYDVIHARRPDIIYASATGYGAAGPLSKGPGQDLLVQGRAGMVAQTGEWQARPTPIGNSGIDQHGAAVLAMGIVAAYVKKLTSGEGTRVEGSLYTACVDLMQEGLVHYFSLGHDRSVMPRDPHLSCWYLGAPYGAYRMKNGAMVISINAYDKLAQALDSEELARLANLDPWDDRDACAKGLARVLADMEYADVAARFERHGIWYEKVQDFDDMLTDPQAEYAEIFLNTEVGGLPVRLINHPVRYDGSPPPYKGMALKAGENTREVLTEIGYTRNEIDGLIAGGAVALAEGVEEEKHA